MRIFLNEKLWRNKAIEMCQEKGSIIHWKYLNDQEYDEQLRLKLIEESHEVKDAITNSELKSELADLLEVIDSLCSLHNITMSDIKIEQERKKAERGGFDERKFVQKVEHPDGSAFAQYCLNQPNKYPEIEQI